MKIAIAAGALVAVALALFALISSSPAAGAAMHGDVDCDGDVDAVDALNVLRSIAGFDVVGECDPPVLDINCNDATEAVDALAILLYVAGFPPPDTGPDCPDIGAEPTPSPSPILTPTPSGSIAPTPTPTPTATGSPTPTPTSTPMPASLCGDPAFAAGATTISSFGPPQEDDYQLVDTGIDAPYATMTDFTTVPYTDGALVLTQDGLIYCVSPNEAPEFLADMSGLLAGGLQIEEGLLTLIFHPDYPAEPYVYIYYNAAREEGESGFAWWDRVSRFEVDLDDDILDLESEEIIIQAEDPAIQHNGAGPIGFGTDGYLYVSFGDGGFGGWDTYASQDTDSLLGKILRIDVLNPPQGQPYGIPGDNPFGNEVWAYGLRNPWRGDIDPDTGDLWVAEVGDGAYDEVIGIVPGGNYGWPIREGPVCWHDREPCDPPPDYVAADVDIPTQFADECAVIGGLVYRGSLMPELGGWFIYSDFCTGDIWGLDTEAVSATPLLLADVDPALPVSSIDSLPGGEIAVTTYDDNGILTLEPKP